MTTTTNLQFEVNNPGYCGEVDIRVWDGDRLVASLYGDETSTQDNGDIWLSSKGTLVAILHPNK